MFYLQIFMDFLTEEIMPDLLKRIRREKPDAVLSAGDMAVRTCPDTLVTACKLLKELAQYFPVYYALGNHEYKNVSFRRKRKTIQDI